jgi:hypothetical protein
MTSILQSSVFKLVKLSLVAIVALVATSRCAALRSRATAVALTGGSYSLSLVIKQQSGNENSK